MDPKTISNSSFTLLVQKNLDITLLFIRSGVPLTQRDLLGSTVLHLAARSGDLEWVTLLVNNGADVNSAGQNLW